MPEKPRHRAGYTPQETELVRSACLTVAITLGAFLDDVVVVGGLVPSLLVDVPSEVGVDFARHPGTADLDLGLSLGLLHDQRYTEVSARLKAEGFTPDTNSEGNQTVQRWYRDGLKVDFLIPPSDNAVTGTRIHNLEPDFGALVTPGLQLAFDERVDIEIDGTALSGEKVKRIVPVCGPGAFVVLKTLAFGDRAEPKDAYDMVYVMRHVAGGVAAIAVSLQRHAEGHPDVVSRALKLIERDFASVDSIGPRRCAQFEHIGAEMLDQAAADAHGYVDDLLAAFRK